MIVKDMSQDNHKMCLMTNYKILLWNPALMNKVKTLMSSESKKAVDAEQIQKWASLDQSGGWVQWWRGTVSLHVHVP